MSYKQEERRPVAGYEGIYEVSDRGRVKALTKIRKNRYGYRTIKEKILTPKSQSGGYMLVILTKNSHRKANTVHRLVAIAFIANPENKPQVNHKNGLKYDNRVENLEWMTCSENHTHAYKFLGRKPSIPPSGKYSILSKKVKQTNMDGSTIKIRGCMSDISRDLGYSIGSISECCNNKQKTSKGYKREFYPS